MSEPYLPARDGRALTWMQTFAAGIAATPGAYQLTPAGASNITAAVEAYAAAYALSQDPAERTPVAIAAKDEMRNLAEQLCRSYAIQIKYNVGVSDTDKIAIGVKPVNPGRTPIVVPASSPLLSVIGSTPGSQTLRYVDSGTPDTRAKPFGAAAIQLFVAVAIEPVTDPSAAKFYGAFTKNPIGVGFASADNGKTATYFARWQSPRGDVGPWSLPVAFTIAA